jgi:hypothetical protein
MFLVIFSVVSLSACSLSELNIPFFSKKNAVETPVIKMRVATNPTSVEDPCQNVSFRIYLENVSKLALSHHQFGNEFAINLYERESSTLVCSSKDVLGHGVFTYDSVISNFGTINPSEKKGITFQCKSYMKADSDIFLLHNNFESLSNGKHKFFFAFEKITEEGDFEEISKSNVFQMESNVRNEEGGPKYCSYKQI